MAGSVQRELSMPTVFRDGPHRFFFYSGEGHEPPHIHVRRDDHVAKFWLDPIRLQNAGGFSPIELRRIQATIGLRHLELMEAWDENFGNQT